MNILKGSLQSTKLLASPFCHKATKPQKSQRQSEKGARSPAQRTRPRSIGMILAFQDSEKRLGVFVSWRLGTFQIATHELLARLGFWLSALDFRLSAFVLLLLGLSACSSPAAAPTVVANKNLPANVAPVSHALDQKGSIPQVGQMAPNFSYTTVDGVEHDLNELQGRIVVLNFWATWCEPCKQEMPTLDRINDKNGDKVIVLGVNKLENTDKIAEFASTIGVKFPLIANPKGDISELYGVRNLPTTYFILPNGRIGEWRPGGMTEEDLMKIIQSLK